MQTLPEQRKRPAATQAEQAADDFMWRTIPCSPISADRRPGAKLRTPPHQKSMLDRASVSVIELKFPTWSWRVLNHHGNRDGCLAGLSSFWFETLCRFGGLQRWCYFSHTYEKPPVPPPLLVALPSLIILCIFPLPPTAQSGNHRSPTVLVRLSYGR